MSIEAMKQALEALTRIWEDGLENFPESGHDAAITALRTAIKASEKQEPLGYWNAVEGWVELPEEAHKPAQPKTTPKWPLKQQWVNRRGHVVWRDVFEGNMKCALDEAIAAHTQAVFVDEGDAKEYCTFKNTTPPTAHPAPVQEPMDREAYMAIREARENASEDAYFAARPEHDKDLNRMMFRCGFYRGYAHTPPAAPREPDDSFDIDGKDAAYALEAILQRAGEGATVGHVIALLENLAKPEQEPVAWAKEYAAINEFYGKQTADRSGLSLMRHIDDGLHILTLNGASDTAKAAFCLHPLVQNSEVVDVSWSPAYSLACEYKGKANAHLCRPDTDWVSSVGDVQSIVGEMTDDCRAMLIADKRQNYGDFIAAHYGKHSRSKELDRYFRLWIAYLEGYTTPPKAQRQWVDLTDEEILEAAGIDGADTWLFETAYAIEAKLKQKNIG